MSVTTTTPVQLENNIVASDDIIIDFDAMLDGASLTSSNIKVWGSQSGLVTATYAGGGTTSLTINPDNDFLAGENVSVVITSGSTRNRRRTAKPLSRYHSKWNLVHLKVDLSKPLRLWTE